MPVNIFEVISCLIGCWYVCEVEGADDGEVVSLCWVEGSINIT
jgi:hypothetical protein